MSAISPKSLDDSLSFRNLGEAIMKGKTENVGNEERRRNVFPYRKKSVSLRSGLFRLRFTQ